MPCVRNGLLVALGATQGLHLGVKYSTLLQNPAMSRSGLDSMFFLRLYC